jgi:hypothetical protein
VRHTSNRRNHPDSLDVIRTIEGRLSALEGKEQLRPTAEMELPNRR